MADATAIPAGQTVISAAFLKRRPELTPEQFYHHWEHVHAPLVKPWAKKHGLKGYTQVHAKAELNQSATPIGPESSEPSPLAGYDGYALIEVSSFDVFAAAFNDEYYLTVIRPDEDKFIDKKVGILRARGEVKRII